MEHWTQAGNGVRVSETELFTAATDADARSLIRAHSNQISQVKQLLRLCADGRREYAQRAPHPSNEHLEIEANTLENAIKILDGDLDILYSLLPSWRWSEAGLPDPEHAES